MPNTLISFIGTGALDKNQASSRLYKMASYSFGQENIGSSSFVSSVLYDHFNIEKLILIGTVKSMWEEVYNFFCTKFNHPLDEDYYWELAERTEQADHNTDPSRFNFEQLEKTLGDGSRVRLIPYGMTETEQWTIFNVLKEVFEELRINDIVHLDVTHAFRSLPLFSLSAILYLKDVIGSQIEIKGIYYGMLETRREFDGVAPIVDLSIIMKIQDWIKSAHSFLNYGKGYLAAQLLEDPKQAKVLTNFSDALSLNYLSGIEDQIKQFRDLADEINTPIAEMMLSPLLRDFTNNLLNSKSQSKFQLELSVWHKKKKNYFSAFLVFTESLITYVCEKENLEWSKLNSRNIAKSQMKKYGLKEIYKATNKIRNNLAHNQNKQINSMEENINLLEKSQNQFLQILISQ